jgi:hypothetical protein
MFIKETTKNKKEAAATKMFQFYVNLLSLDANYMWNNIVREQAEADLYKDLKGVSRKDPRGLLRESFDKCLMFHPSHCVSQQRSGARKIPPFQPAQEAPEGWHTLVCTACREAQRLRCAAALLVLQPKLQCQYDAGKYSVLRG